MLRKIICFGLMLLISGSVLAGTPKSLVGRYQMEMPGGDILELRADGTASLGGEETRWTAKGNLLTVGTDSMTYQIVGGKLLLNMGGIELPWKKLGSTVPAPQTSSSTPAPPEGYGGITPQRYPGNARGVPRDTPEMAPLARFPAPAQTAGNAQDVEARQLLTSSAWCAFSYSKFSGTTSTRKVIFQPNGILMIFDGAETYSSGYGGTHAGQSARSGSMRWKLRNLRLYIDQGDGTGFRDANLTAEKNSSGWPILHADGREYSMCK